MASVQSLDKKYIWHPCSQMKDYESFPSLEINSAFGSTITLANGHKLIDAISSWWCKSLGHGHPRIKSALQQQVEKFEHVIFANTTYDAIAQLSAMLGSLMPGLSKVFYAGDGSCAIEVALKMSLHYHQLAGYYNKTKFVALQNGYHGETSGALSVSDVGLYRDPYGTMLFEPILLQPKYVSGCKDEGWDNAAEHWQHAESQLQQNIENIAAIIVEPIVQGAGGMKIYSQDFLARLAKFATDNGIHLIADEIMTGIGRTGAMLACEYAKIVPDFVCLSKGLTSGWLPFSAVLTTDKIYEAFYDDYAKGKSFLHSHTYSGNALGAAIAVEVLNIIKEENLCQRATLLNKIMLANMQEVAQQTGVLNNIRGIGGIVAADLNMEDLPYRAGYRVYQRAVELGALLRPLGNTIYWLPPLNIYDEDLLSIKNITIESIIDVLAI